MFEEEDGFDFIEESQYVTVALGVIIYLKNRHDPLFAQMTMRFDKADLPATIEELTDCFTASLMKTLNMRSEFMLILEDEQNNKVFVLFDELQSISVRAPDEFPKELL